MYDKSVLRLSGYLWGYLGEQNDALALEILADTIGKSESEVREYLMSRSDVPCEAGIVSFILRRHPEPVFTVGLMQGVPSEGPADRYSTELIDATVAFFGDQIDADGAKHLLGAIEYAVRSGPVGVDVVPFVRLLGQFIRRND